MNIKNNLPKQRLLDSPGDPCRAGPWNCTASSERIQPFCFDACGLIGAAVITYLPKRRSKSRSLAQTMQWMGLSGVSRIVHTGKLFGTDLGWHSKHSVAATTFPVVGSCTLKCTVACTVTRACVSQWCAKESYIVLCTGIDLDHSNVSFFLQHCACYVISKWLTKSLAAWEAGTTLDFFTHPWPPYLHMFWCGGMLEVSIRLYWSFRPFEKDESVCWCSHAGEA